MRRQPCGKSSRNVKILAVEFLAFFSVAKRKEGFLRRTDSTLRTWLPYGSVWNVHSNKGALLYHLTVRYTTVTTIAEKSVINITVQIAVLENSFYNADWQGNSTPYQYALLVLTLLERVQHSTVLVLYSSRVLIEKKDRPTKTTWNRWLTMIRPICRLRQQTS